MIYTITNKLKKKVKRKLVNIRCLYVRGSQTRGYMSNATQPYLLDNITLTQYHKYTLVKFKVSAGSPLVSQSNINAIIGPHGVNIMNLQKKLEPLNNIFIKGTIVPVFLKIYDFDLYHVYIKTPTLSSLLNDINSNFLSIYQVYELVEKKKKDITHINLSEQSIYFSILGYLKSGNKSIYYNEKKEHINVKTSKNDK